MSFGNLQIPKDVRQQIERELQPGEFIRWVDKPATRIFELTSIVVILFAIPWTAFAIFWMWGAAGYKIPDLRQGLQPQYIFALFGIPFVLIGLGMLSTPYWVWKAAQKTVYLITDKRAILIQGGISTTIRSYTPSQIQHVYRKEAKDGTGDVIISVRKWKDSDGDLMTEEIGFIGIRNPQEVERKLKKLAENAL